MLIASRWRSRGVLSLIAVSGLAWFLTHRAPSQPSVELTQKRLTFNSNENPVVSNAISPDGKYLAYSDPAGIHVKLISTGEERLIPRPAGVPADAEWHVESWFPDGTQLLADTYEPGGHGRMWTVSLLGQSPRELHEGLAFAGGVSPDGTRIAFTPQPGASGDVREIWMMVSREITLKRSLPWEKTKSSMVYAGRPTDSAWPTLRCSGLPKGTGVRSKPAA